MEKEEAVALWKAQGYPLNTDKALYSLQQILARVKPMLVQIQLSPFVHYHGCWKMHSGFEDEERW